MMNLHQLRSHTFWLDLFGWRNPILVVGDVEGLNLLHQIQVLRHRRRQAPTWLNISLPFLKAINVGMNRIWAVDASCRSALVSTFKCAMSECFSDYAWNIGTNARHTAHQDTQKATSTMSLPLLVSCLTVQQ